MWSIILGISKERFSCIRLVCYELLALVLIMLLGLTASASRFPAIGQDRTGEALWQFDAMLQASNGQEVPYASRPLVATPTRVIAVPVSANEINLTWTDTAVNETGYRISRRLTSTTSWTVIATVAANTTSYNSTGLRAATGYTYQVCAVASGGTLACAADVAATTLATTAAPTGILFMASSSTQVDLRWTDAATNETGYQVFRRLTSATDTPVNWIILAILSPNATTYTSTGLTPATGYTYRICSVAPGGARVCAADVAVTTLAVTAAPNGVAAMASSPTQIELRWTDAAINERGYRISRRLTSATDTPANWTILAVLVSNSTSYIDAGLTAATGYTYRVCAIAPGSVLVCALDRATITLATTAPTGVTATPISAAPLSATQISLAWTDAATNETGYRIKRRLTSATKWTVLPALFANSTSYIDTGLKAATGYTYQVCAVAPGGEVCAADVSAATTQGGVTTFNFTTASVSADGSITSFLGVPAPQYEENLGGGIKLEMVVIPRGSFAMGSPTSEAGRLLDEGPQRVVSVNRFVLGKYEVTQAQWSAVMGTNPSWRKGDNLPVEQVSWIDAREFCRRLNARLGLSETTGYRLPTEAEWEYAARAGTTTPFTFGDTIHANIVNYDGRFPYGRAPIGVDRNRTVNVDSLGVANSWGLYDMSGNVWEWCEDDWHSDYNSAPINGSAWLDTPRAVYRIMRGGGWGNAAVHCRSARRAGYTPASQLWDVGFRLARTLP